MWQKIVSYLSAFALAVVLSACAAPGPPPGDMQIRSGVIEQITTVQLASNHHAGVGAVAVSYTHLDVYKRQPTHEGQ